MDEQHLSACANCNLPVLADFYFCPNCGKSLRNKPFEVSLGKQIGVYLLSFFLPPFGIPFAIKYLKQPDQKTKTIGIVVLCLTIVSLGLTIYFYSLFVQKFYGIYNQLSSPSQNFGF